eukprot:5947350-Pleurochrysis_carterae.AAC.2
MTPEKSVLDRDGVRRRQVGHVAVLHASQVARRGVNDDASADAVGDVGAHEVGHLVLSCTASPSRCPVRHITLRS